MKKTIKSHLLLLTFLSTSIYSGDIARTSFIPRISLDDFRSLIENNRFLTFCLCTATGIGSYFLYKYFVSSKQTPILPNTEQNNQSEPEIPQPIVPNIKWV